MKVWREPFQRNLVALGSRLPPHQKKAMKAEALTATQCRESFKAESDGE